PVEQARVVGHVGQLGLGPDGLGVQVVAGDAQAPARGLEDAGQGAEGRRLAGAVGAGQAGDLARGDREGGPLDGHGFAVGLVEVFDADRHCRTPWAVLLRLPYCTTGTVARKAAAAPPGTSRSGAKKFAGGLAGLREAATTQKVPFRRAPSGTGV